MHAPGTLLNNQFTGSDAWNQYLTKLEQAQPVIEAVGATDYYTLATYERLIAEKAKGRIANVGLVLPNIEMRLVTGTMRGRAVNIHLLVSPDDPNHVFETRRFLARLTFSAHGDSFACRDEDFPAWQEDEFLTGWQFRPLEGGRAVQGRTREPSPGVSRERLGEGEHSDRGCRDRDGRYIRGTRRRV